MIKLLDEEGCGQLRALCPSVANGAEDLKALECVQNLSQEQVDALTDDCQHLIWKHTLALMDDQNIHRLVQKGEYSNNCYQTNVCNRTISIAQ